MPAGHKTRTASKLPGDTGWEADQSCQHNGKEYPNDHVIFSSGTHAAYG